MHIEYLPGFEYRRMRWKNALGWTREIQREPDREDFDWRVSIAEIDHNCEFSPFPEFDRILMLISGNGMRLDFPDGRTVDMQPPGARVEFRGEDAPACHLYDGPTRDFNLIWKRGRCRPELLHRPLVGPMLFFPEPDTTWLVYLLAGRAAVKDRPDIAALDTGDSLLLRCVPGASQRVIVDGGGEVLLVRCGPPRSA